MEAIATNEASPSALIAEDAFDEEAYEIVERDDMTLDDFWSEPSSSDDDEEETDADLSTTDDVEKIVAPFIVPSPQMSVFNNALRSFAGDKNLQRKIDAAKKDAQPQQKGTRKQRPGAAKVPEQRRMAHTNAKAYVAAALIIIERRFGQVPKNCSTRTKQVLRYLRAVMQDHDISGHVSEIGQVRAWCRAMTNNKAIISKKRIHLKKHNVECRELALLDEKLFAHFKELRAKKILVTAATLQEAAGVLLTNDPLLRGTDENRISVSKSYIYRFMARKDLVLRRVKKHSSISEETFAAKAQTFHEQVASRQLDCDVIVNMDQVPMSLSGAQNGKSVRTIVEKKDTDAAVNLDANHYKRICSLMVTVGLRRDENGEFTIPFALNPLILFKGKPKQDRVKNEVYAPGVDVVWTPKGVIDSDTMIQHYIPLLRAALNKCGLKKCLLILDSAKPHISLATKPEYQRNNICEVVIPAGYTGWLQWVDTFFAAVYRSRHFKLYQKIDVKTSTMNTRQLLAHLVSEAFPKMINKEALIDAFASLGYTRRDRVLIRGQTGYAPDQAKIHQVCADWLKNAAERTAAEALKAEVPASVEGGNVPEVEDDVTPQKPQAPAAAQTPSTTAKKLKQPLITQWLKPKVVASSDTPTAQRADLFASPPPKSKGDSKRDLSAEKREELPDKRMRTESHQQPPSEAPATASRTATQQPSSQIFFSSNVSINYGTMDRSHMAPHYVNRWEIQPATQQKKTPLSQPVAEIDVDEETLKQAELMEYVRDPSLLVGKPQEFVESVKLLIKVFSDKSDFSDAATPGRKMCQSHFELHARHIHATLSQRPGSRRVFMFTTDQTLTMRNEVKPTSNLLPLAMAIGARTVDYAFFPHLADGHFFASVLDVTSTPLRLGYYSSAAGQSYERYHSEFYTKVRAMDRHMQFSPSFDSVSASMIQQFGSNDCGLFVLNFLVYLITGQWGGIRRASFTCLDGGELAVAEMCRGHV